MSVLAPFFLYPLCVLGATWRTACANTISEPATLAATRGEISNVTSRKIRASAQHCHVSQTLVCRGNPQSQANNFRRSYVQPETNLSRRARKPNYWHHRKRTYWECVGSPSTVTPVTLAPAWARYVLPLLLDIYSAFYCFPSFFSWSPR